MNTFRFGNIPVRSIEPQDIYPIKYPQGTVIKFPKLKNAVIGKYFTDSTESHCIYVIQVEIDGGNTFIPINDLRKSALCRNTEGNEKKFKAFKKSRINRKLNEKTNYEIVKYLAGKTIKVKKQIRFRYETKNGFTYIKAQLYTRKYF